MKDAQERLDGGARMLMRLIKQAEKGAEEACEAGQAQAAARLHRMAAHMRLAYAEGRELTSPMPDGGIITPAFGGDGK
jgi:hypothetical protein